MILHKSVLKIKCHKNEMNIRNLLERKKQNLEISLFQEDTKVQFERRNFYESSMEYVLVLQEVQERKKFEFVETVSASPAYWTGYNSTSTGYQTQYRSEKLL